MAQRREGDLTRCTEAGCDAEIRFFRTQRNAWMPCNVPAVTMAMRDDGPDCCFLARDRCMIRGKILRTQDDREEATVRHHRVVLAYVSHFATCPAAQSFKRTPVKKG